VVAFVRSNLQPDIRRANFVIVLEWLKNLSEKDDMPLQEACVLTLCRLARFVYERPIPESIAHWIQNSVSEDEEKNIILLRLLEYLGHPNPYVCAVAYNEVR
jgi:serine/threonine-protein kinase ATR